ncbi:MAG TPA: methionine biosynthesis protein MetW [Candidatus Limnocylindrales bacterium]|nr:methionine biosynthesis protein MetW [Candidatus Limnocylindrales bacterium]
MTESLRQRLRTSSLRPAYLWLANRYRTLRRLFVYPDTARVGVVDYDDYWEKKAQSGMGILSPWRLKRARVFAQIVAPGDRVLDLGVGDGALLAYLIQERTITGCGLDVSASAVDYCVAHGLDVRLSDINRPIGEVIHEQFGPGAQFDYVIMSEIIEHLPDPEALLIALRPLVRKGLIVSIPNTGYHQHRLRLLLGKFPLQWVVTPGEHLRYWTLADFRWWARQLGFRLRAEFPYEGTPGLKRLWPSLFAAAFVYLLE